jgi:hypothetical protein
LPIDLNEAAALLGESAGSRRLLPVEQVRGECAQERWLR